MSKLDTFKLTFLGAAQTVTGSMHHLQVGDKSVLVDCGLFQGRRAESKHKNRHLSNLAVDADAVILTHAHIDHSGNLPRLVRVGFKGKIHCTSATRDLCEHMLRDSAHIHESDAAYLNRKNANNPNWEKIEPLYTQKDAEEALKHFVSHNYPYSGNAAVSICNYEILKTLCYYTGVLDVEQRR